MTQPHRQMGPETDEGVNLTPGVRAWLIGRGVLYAGLGLLGFIFADSVATAWPWPIRPLELRVFIGQLAVVSWGGLAVMRSRFAWQSHRLGALLAAALGLFQLIGLVAGLTPYHASSLIGIFLPVMFVEWVAVAVVLFVLYRRR